MLDLEGLAAIVLRVSVLYVYALAILRLTGKRAVGQLAGSNVVATIIVGDMFDDIVWGEISLAKGLTGLTTVFALHLLTKALEYRSAAVKRVLDGVPMLAVLNGKFAANGLRRERISEDSLREVLRVCRIDNLGDVREARVEVDGEVSVLKFEERREAQKREKNALREVAT